MAIKTIYVDDIVWNRTLGCEVKILSEERPDGTIHIETPYGRVYCYPHDLEARDLHGSKDKKIKK